MATTPPSQFPGQGRWSNGKHPFRTLVGSALGSEQSTSNAVTSALLSQESWWTARGNVIYTNVGASLNAVAASTIALTVGVDCAIGDTLVAGITCDNAAAGGTSPISSVTDSAGNTWTAVAAATTQSPGGVASDGVTHQWFTSTLTAALANGVGVITANFSTSVTAKALRVHRFVASSSTHTLRIAANGSTSGAGTSFSLSVPAGSHMRDGSALIVESGVENLDTQFVDSDPLGGQWDVLGIGQASTGVAATSLTFGRQTKLLCDTAAQSFDWAWTNSTDYVAEYLVVEVNYDKAVVAASNVGPTVGALAGRDAAASAATDVVAPSPGVVAGPAPVALVASNVAAFISAIFTVSSDVAATAFTSSGATSTAISSADRVALAASNVAPVEGVTAGPAPVALVASNVGPVEGVTVAHEATALAATNVGPIESMTVALAPAVLAATNAAGSPSAVTALDRAIAAATAAGLVVGVTITTTSDVAVAIVAPVGATVGVTALHAPAAIVATNAGSVEGFTVTHDPAVVAAVNVVDAGKVTASVDRATPVVIDLTATPKATAAMAAVIEAYTSAGGYTTAETLVAIAGRPYVAVAVYPHGESAPAVVILGRALRYVEPAALVGADPAVLRYVEPDALVGVDPAPLRWRDPQPLEATT